MTAKFLSNSNLNLFLSELYKNKLKSQMKNTKTHTQIFITFTTLFDISQINFENI